jgi:Zn-dependent M16 (insulinase) family peptidase
MWDKIRLEGGAYGGGCGFVAGKYCYLYSYRDPQLEKTFENFSRLGEYLQTTEFTVKDIDRFIIGAVNEEDIPEKNNARGSIALRYHIMGITEDALNERRCEMLDITAQQIKEFGAKLEEGSKKSVLVTVGNENSVKNNDIFQEFLHIH